MAETINLTQVDFTSVNENVNLIIEEGHELKRLNLEEAFGALGLPSYETEDNNKILSIVNGTPAWVSLKYASEVEF